MKRQLKNKRIIILICFLLFIIVVSIFYFSKLNNNTEITLPRKVCEQNGGLWHRLHDWGEDVCDKQYPDGGKRCNDKTDCLSGQCIFDIESIPRAETLSNDENFKFVGDNKADGKCAEWDHSSTDTCYSYLLKGKVFSYCGLE